MKLSNCFAIGNTIACSLFCLFLPVLGFATEGLPTTKTIFQSFESGEVVNIRITLDLDTLMANKMKVDYQPAMVTIDSDNGLISQDIKVRVRGRSRRKYCEFPPLKLKFGKENLAAIGLNNQHLSLIHI